VVPGGQMQTVGMCQISREMNDMLLSGKVFLSNMCRTEHTSRGRGYIVKATWVPNRGISGWGGYIMRRTNRYISLLFLTAAIAAPALVVAEAKAQEASVQVRVYDRDHRDYHNWDDHEDRAYRRYLAEQHRSYREYHRQHYRTQRHYWNWRHSHPDRD
jgi:hypothetical protein